PLAVDVLRADGDDFGPRYILAEIWNAQAAFALFLFAFRVDDLGIGQYQFGVGVFLEGDVDDGEALRDADLRRSKANALSLVHGFEHVVDELLQFVAELGDICGFGFQNRVSKFNDGIDHREVSSFQFQVPGFGAVLCQTAQRSRKVLSFKVSSRRNGRELETRNSKLETFQLLQISFKVAASLEHGVAAEFFQRKLRQRERDHGFANNSGRGHHAHVRALIRRLYRFAGGEVH